jgi:hypothetical protein
MGVIPIRYYKSTSSKPKASDLVQFHFCRIVALTDTQNLDKKIIRDYFSKFYPEGMSILKNEIDWDETDLNRFWIKAALTKLKEIFPEYFL